MDDGFVLVSEHRFDERASPEIFCDDSTVLAVRSQGGTRSVFEVTEEGWVPWAAPTTDPLWYDRAAVHAERLIAPNSSGSAEMRLVGRDAGGQLLSFETPLPGGYDGWGPRRIVSARGELRVLWTSRPQHDTWLTLLQ